METDSSEYYYLAMLNAISGICDDMAENDAPEEAKFFVNEALRICRIDYGARFGLIQKG